MEIGKLTNANVAIADGKTVSAANAANANGVDDSAAASAAQTEKGLPGTVEQDFHLELNDVVRQKLSEMTKNLQARQAVLDGLPADIGRATAQLLQQTAANAEQVGQGLVEVFKAQRQTADALTDLADTLQTAVLAAEMGDDATGLATDLAQRLRLMLQADSAGVREKIAATPNLATLLPELSAAEIAGVVDENVQQNRMSQTNPAGLTTTLRADSNNVRIPGESNGTPAAANPAAAQLTELVQLVKQVTEQDRNVLQTLQRLAANTTPEQLKTLLPEQRQAGMLLESALAQQQPAELPEVAARHQLSGLSTAWTVRTAAAAEPYLQLAPDEQKTAVATLRELAQTIQPGAERTSVPASGERISAMVERLPAAVQDALTNGLAQPGGVAEKITKMAAVLENAVVLKQAAVTETGVTGKSAFTADVKSLLDAAVPSAAAAGDEAGEIAKAVRQTAIKDVLTGMLDGKVERLQQGLDLRRLEADRTWSNLQQKAEQQGMPLVSDSIQRRHFPELTKAALALRVAAAAQWQGHDATALKQAAAALKEMSAAVQRPAIEVGSSRPEHSVLSFTTELQMGQGVMYPAHIHIYHQRQPEGGQRGETGGEYETWLRISLETQHIGDVTAVFRVYDHERLDVRVGFKDADALQQFRRGLPELRQKLETEQLRLHELGGNQI